MNKSAFPPLSNSTQVPSSPFHLVLRSWFPCEIIITQTSTFPLPGGFCGLLTTLELGFTRHAFESLVTDGLKLNKCLCSLTAGLEIEHVEVVIDIELEDIASVSFHTFVSVYCGYLKQYQWHPSAALKTIACGL